MNFRKVRDDRRFVTDERWSVRWGKIITPTKQRKTFGGVLFLFYFLFQTTQSFDTDTDIFYMRFLLLFFIFNKSSDTVHLTGGNIFFFSLRRGTSSVVIVLFLVRGRISD